MKYSALIILVLKLQACYRFRLGCIEPERRNSINPVEGKEAFSPFPWLCVEHRTVWKYHKILQHVQQAGCRSVFILPLSLTSTALDFTRSSNNGLAFTYPHKYDLCSRRKVGSRWHFPRITHSASASNNKRRRASVSSSRHRDTCVRRPCRGAVQRDGCVDPDDFNKIPAELRQ